jgi:putative oxidoreductase
MVWTLPGTAQFFVSVGFPGWLAYPVTAVELFGGILLLLGIQVRWVALILGVELLFAMIPHLGNGWMFQNPYGGWEYPAFLALTAFALSLSGDGRYALMPSHQLIAKD